MTLSGLTPTGLAFSIILILIVFAGIGVILRHSSFIPKFRRKRAAKQYGQIDLEKLEKLLQTPYRHSEPTSPQSSSSCTLSPDLEEVVTPESTPRYSILAVAQGSAVGGIASPTIICGNEMALGMELTTPPRAYYGFSRKVYIPPSPKTADGKEAMWWFY